MKIKHEYTEDDLKRIVTEHLKRKKRTRNVVSVAFVVTPTVDRTSEPAAKNVVSCVAEFEDGPEAGE